MENSEKKYNLQEIIKNYESLIIDIWGVVHDGIKPYENVIETINILNIEKKIIFLSNTPRPSYLASKKLCELGINIREDQIYTSGDAIREQLKLWDDDVFKTLGKNLYHIGGQRNKDILHNISVQEVNELKSADFILLTAYLDEGENLDQFRDLFSQAIKRNIPLICANPDEIVINGDYNRYCAGVFAKQYNIMGGRTYYYGKPDIRIYDRIFDKIKTNKSKTLMIGDTIYTDIKGAINAEIDSLLVLTGNGKNYNISNKSDQIKPTWILPSLSFK